MGDHFVLLVDRLLTESTLEAALESRNRIKQTIPPTEVEENSSEFSPKDCGADLSPRKNVECRICQDEDWDSNMEAPCSCSGSLKYAHRRCVQRWCNEKGDTVCEICHQHFWPGYTAPPSIFRLRSIPMNFRRDVNNSRLITMVSTDESLLDQDEYAAASSSRSIMCCQLIALIIMILLVLQHALPIIVNHAGHYSFPLITLLLLRVAGIILPVYIIMKVVTGILRLRQNRNVNLSVPSSHEEASSAYLLKPLMETQTTESSQQAVINSDVAADRSPEDPLPDIPNHCEIVSGHDFSKEEVIGILEAIAGTGKFCRHDWDKLKYMFSFHLKQVLAEYPEATMPSEEQTLSLRETFPELVKRLDDALQSFIEGPPFTLQRLCEILLAAQSIYPRLVKLALALEKNLFVTSMLTKSTDEPAAPVEQVTTTTAPPPERANGETKSSPPSNSLPNGVETTITGDQDEVMAEVEEAEVEDDMTMDMETVEDIVQSSSETNSTETNSTTAATVVDS